MLGLAIIAGLILISAWSGRELKDNQLVTIFATISSGAIRALAGFISYTGKINNNNLKNYMS